MWDKIISVLGGNLFTGVGDIISKFVPDPTKQAEIKLELAKLQTQTELRLEEVGASDRDSARKREMEVKDHTTAILMYTCTAGFFGILAYMLMFPVPQANERILDMMLGSLGTAWVMGWAYYYGSSTGSASKQAMIGKMQERADNKGG